MILPSELQTEVADILAGGQPKAAVRALGDIHGDLGESYLLSDGTLLVVFSRKLGATYVRHDFRLADLRDLQTSEDRPYCYLDLDCKDRHLRFKLSSFDADAVAALLALWQQACSGGPAPSATPAAAAPAAQPTVTAPAAPEADRDELTPIVGFAAALHALVNADAAVAAEERHMLTRIIDDEAVLNQGAECLAQLGTEGLLERLDGLLNSSQKLCLIANLVDLAMVDGTLRSTERRLIKGACAALNIDEDSYVAIFDVLLVKNNVGVFAVG